MYDKCNMGIKQREWTSSSIGKVVAEQPIPLTPFGILSKRELEGDKQRLGI